MSRGHAQGPGDVVMALPGAQARTHVPAVHYSSHADLLTTDLKPGKGVPDAIVVAASRPARRLRPALRLGARLGIPVIALCSGDATLKAVRETAWLEGATCIGVDLRDQPKHLPRLRTSDFAHARAGALGDLALKRNLGLVIGQLLGWRTLLFLDDDISGLDPEEIEHAAAALRTHTAIGLRAFRFPDNSVVCHAHRTGRADQDVFVSGSALAVRLADADAFFPEVYNEDWLFLAPLLDRRAVGALGSVQQERYAPFADPDRARRQEFGDVLAEGLIGYLHERVLQRLPSRAYWVSFLAERAEFIADVENDCLAAAGKDADAVAALPALTIARETLAGLTAEALVAYLDAWQADLVTWRRFVRGLPRFDEPAGALRWLGLRWRTTQVVRAEAFPAVTPVRRRLWPSTRRTLLLTTGRGGLTRPQGRGVRALHGSSNAT